MLEGAGEEGEGEGEGEGGLRRQKQEPQHLGCGEENKNDMLCVQAMMASYDMI